MNFLLPRPESLFAPGDPQEQEPPAWPLSRPAGERSWLRAASALFLLSEKLGSRSLLPASHLWHFLLSRTAQLHVAFDTQLSCFYSLRWVRARSSILEELGFALGRTGFLQQIIVSS